MKKSVLVVSLALLACACSDRERLIPWPDFPDAETRADAGTWDPDYPICDPENTAALQTDERNCGACGNACTRDTSDRCVAGECRCGPGAACEEGSDCIGGRCIVSDRNTVCETSDDCSIRQSCIARWDGEKRCVEVCEFDEVCAPGHYCVEGACTFVECAPEDCNGLDDDCDGTVDEAADGSPLARFCYSGPETDYRSIMEPCQAGVQVCLPEGRWSECRDEIPPVEEQGLLACDLIDNDCDGCVDGVLEDGVCYSSEPTAFDVVFVIDTSGSMSGTIMAVQTAVNISSSTWSVNPQFRFGIVLVPGMDDGEVELYHDLSDFPAFETSLTAMSSGTGGSEPQWDAVYELGNGELPMSWRTGSARIIVVFTDEEGQSYRMRRGLGANINETDMCAALTHGEVLATVTTPIHSRDFDDCGLIFDLTSDAVMMAEQLDTIITDPCR